MSDTARGLGPAHNPHWRTEIGPYGLQAFRDGSATRAPAVHWRGRWIWLDPARFPAAQRCDVSVFAWRNGGPERTAGAGLFRKTIELADAPAGAWIRISADTRYRCWMNGRLAGRGPAMVGGSYGWTEPAAWWYEDLLDVNGLLGAGRNVVAVEVLLGPDAATDFSQGRGGLRFDLVMERAEGIHVWGSDETWRATHTDAYGGRGQWSGQSRSCDARRLPVGWQGLDFDDSTWSAAAVLGTEDAARWKLRGHRLPPLAEVPCRPVEVIVPFAETRERVRNADALVTGAGEMTVLPGSDATFYVRFDRELAGHLQLLCDGSAGTEVLMAGQEIPGRDEHANCNQRIVLPGGELAFESPAYVSARAVRVCVVSPAGAQPLRLRRVGLLARTHPVAYRGELECSEPRWSALWRACRWNVQLCLQDIHLDSPHHQEPLGDHGDYLVEMLCGYHAFGDYELAHEDLRRMTSELVQRDGDLFHTSYALLMPDLAADLLQYTGDEDTSRAALPAIRRVLDLTLGWRGDEGLISQAPDYMFIDWIEHAGSNYHHPPAAQGMGPLTAFTVGALRRAAWLCRRFGEADEAARWESEADRMAAAFRTLLFDGARGCFCDGIPGLSRVPTGQWLPADPPAKVFTRHTNILAAWAGIVTGDEAAAALERTLDDPSLPEPQPYFQHYLFDALDSCGLYERRARRQLDLWQPHLDANPAGLREMWDHGDYSHGWGATPLYQLSSRVLGASPVEPGWKRAVVRPHALGLSWARGKVPTPLGEIAIAWERHGSEADVRIEAPSGVQVDTNLSGLGATRVRLNGQEQRAPR